MKWHSEHKRAWSRRLYWETAWRFTLTMRPRPPWATYTYCNVNILLQWNQTLWIRSLEKQRWTDNTELVRRWHSQVFSRLQNRNPKELNRRKKKLPPVKRLLIHVGYFCSGILHIKSLRYQGRPLFFFFPLRSKWSFQRENGASLMLTNANVDLVSLDLMWLPAVTAATRQPQEIHKDTNHRHL